MSKFSLPVMADHREQECRSCECFNPNRMSCEAVKQKTGGEGYLFHTNGLVNPKVSCPLKRQRWEAWIPLHLWYVNQYLVPGIIEVDTSLAWRILKNGVQFTGILELTNNLRAINPILPLSLTVDEIERLRNYENEYDHVNESPSSYLMNDWGCFRFNRLFPGD